MKKVRNILIVLGVLIVIALITNPSFDKHKERIQQKFEEQNPVTGMLGMGKVMINLLQYKNYYVYSYTYEPYKNNKVSFGILGGVFVINLDINQVLDEVKGND